MLHVSTFWLGNVTSVNPTKTNLYTVPTGYRAVLRSIAARNLNGSASQSFYVFINGTIIHSELLTSGGSSGGSTDWLPWIVFDEGQTLQMAASTSTGFGVVAGGSLYTI